MTSEYPAPEAAQSPNLRARLEPLRHEHRLWSEPEMFDVSRPADERRMHEMLDSGELRQGDVVDPIQQIAADLFEMNHPDKVNDQAAREAYVEDVVARGPAFGRWFRFEWSGKLVHYASPEDHQALMTFRNRELITKEEQDRLSRATILVGGLSVGSHVVTRIACSGIGSTWILVDPDELSYPNLGRFDASPKDISASKAHFVAQRVSEKNPYAHVVPMQAAVNRRLLESLRNKGLPKPSIIFDEVDHIGTKIDFRVFAHLEGIALVMATDVGETSLADVERHDLDSHTPFFGGRLTEELIRRIERGEASQAEIAQATVTIIGRKYIPPRLWTSVQQIGKTLGGYPQLGDTAAANGSLAAKVTRAVLLEDMDEHDLLSSGRYGLSVGGIKRLDEEDDPAMEATQQDRHRFDVGELGAFGIDASLNM